MCAKYPNYDNSPGAATFQPELIQASDLVRLAELHRAYPALRRYSSLNSQLRELVKSLHPSTKFTEEELTEAVTLHLNGTPLDQYGVWAWYPWSERLVHLLDEEEFIHVRTDRNRNKITAEEQALLRTKKVGVVGLSVGREVSMTLALERGCGEIRLADHDQLDLSNLNRLRSTVHDLGVNKAVLAARNITEIDPFLKVKVFPDGITQENMDPFFNDGGQLDLLVEECDSVDVKVFIRQKARELGVPVVMDTSDRGLLDIERFDLEPDRPILHGLVNDLEPAVIHRPMTNQEKLPLLGKMVGMETLSTRMKGSLAELGKTLSTWPQLASSVALGGSIVAEVIRKIFLGEHTTSGRWWNDLPVTTEPPHSFGPGNAPVP